MNDLDTPPALKRPPPRPLLPITLPRMNGAIQPPPPPRGPRPRGPPLEAAIRLRMME